jgi:hypothetical protein
MALRFQHGITGEFLWTLPSSQVEDYTAWDAKLELQEVLPGLTPFQIEIMIGKRRLLLFRPLSEYFPPEQHSADVLIRCLQPATEMQWSAIMRSLHWNDPTMLCLILSEGLDLSIIGTGSTRPPDLLCVAIRQDSGPPSHELFPDMSYPYEGACLTFLLLCARADPNLSHPQHQPASPIGLVVQQGQQGLLSMLIQFRANVHPESDYVPPLFYAALGAFQSAIDFLLQSGADPWRQVLGVKYH